MVQCCPMLAIIANQADYCKWWIIIALQLDITSGSDLDKAIITAAHLFRMAGRRYSVCLFLWFYKFSGLFFSTLGDFHPIPPIQVLPYNAATSIWFGVFQNGWEATSLLADYFFLSYLNHILITLWKIISPCIAGPESPVCTLRSPTFTIGFKRPLLHTTSWWYSSQ